MDDTKKMEIRLDNAQVITERRYDQFGSSTSVVKTDEGFLRVQMRATRVGVFKYLRKDGSISRELRHPEDVFAPESLATMAGKPLTLLHPKNIPNGLVTSKNVSQISVGLSGDSPVVTDNAFVDTTGTITNERGVREVERRMELRQDQEVSCGYKCDMLEESGIFLGEVYDRRQVNIRYNHIALVPKGRAGNNCKLRLDEDEAILYDKHIQLEDNSMETIKIDGQEFEVSVETAKAFRKLEAKHDEAISTSKKETAKAEAKTDAINETMAEVKKASSKLEAKADGFEDEVKTLKAEKENKMDAETMDALVEERTSICEAASKLVKDFKKDGLSNLEIKKQVIVAISPDVKLDEKSEDYVDARFDGIVENMDSYKDKLKDIINDEVKKDGEDKNNETKFDSAKSRANMVAESTNAWEQPLSTTRD